MFDRAKKTDFLDILLHYFENSVLRIFVIPVAFDCYKVSGTVLFHTFCKQ